MIYLTPESLVSRSNQDDIDVLTGGDPAKLNDPELDAISEVGSYLSGRYDTDLIFAPDQAEEAKHAIIKRVVADVMLYNLMSAINPRNIPEFRIQKRDDAISWLKAVANPRSNVTADFLPLKDFGEGRGNDITWGSRPKRQNHY